MNFNFFRGLGLDRSPLRSVCINVRQVFQFSVCIMGGSNVSECQCLEIKSIRY